MVKCDNHFNRVDGRIGSTNLLNWLSLEKMVYVSVEVVVKEQS